MDVELLIADPSGEKAYLPITEEGIEWSTERRSTPGKLTFKIVKDSIINFQEGAAVRLKVDGKPVFFGFVFSKKRDKDQIITVTAYDQLRYLQNKDTYVYEKDRFRIHSDGGSGLFFECWYAGRYRVQNRFTGGR